MTLAAVPPGELAAVVTYLEMRERPVPSPLPGSPFALERRHAPDLAGYRALFRRVGAPWLWFSRLAMSDAALAVVVHDPAVEVFVAVDAGNEVGLVELDLRVAGQCALAYVGLVPQLAGTGHGRWLAARALELAWRPGVGRVHLHTCTLDHPAALPAYLRAGFTVTGRAVERFPDPRLTGLLGPDDAPQVKVLPTSAVRRR